MTDTSTEAVARLAHQMDNLGFDDVFELLHALAAERDALKAERHEAAMALRNVLAGKPVRNADEIIARAALQENTDG